MEELCQQPLLMDDVSWLLQICQQRNLLMRQEKMGEHTKPDILGRRLDFEKASLEHQKTIFSWLAEPHMQEFWDNSQEHKDDILCFMHGRVSTSKYFHGIFSYWVASIDKEPFCFIMTAEVDKNDELPPIWLENISITGTTYSIDFGIGDSKYLGKGLASATLKGFVKFFQEQIDSTADTFFIDPAENNPRAKHVYKQAGFEMVGEFKMDKGVFQGEQTLLMVKKYPRSLKTKPKWIKKS